ncbi:MAG: ATP-dependent Clp protease proteolytic subunit [Opitutales bacterium]
MSYVPLPTIYERDGRTERAWDIYSRLLRDRIIFIGTPINDFVANSVIAQMLFLQMEDPKKDISLYINSPGGSVTDGMAIYDTMNFLKCDVITYCVGQAASLATLLLAAGTKGKRFALPNSRVMMHQPVGGATGQTSDISIAAKEIVRWRERMNELLASHTNKTPEEIGADSDRDFYLLAEEAVEYGIVDKVIESKSESKAEGKSVTAS